MKRLNALIAATLLTAACTGTVDELGEPMDGPTTTLGSDPTDAGPADSATAEESDSSGDADGPVLEQGGLVASALWELPQLPEGDGLVQISIGDLAAGAASQRVESAPIDERLRAVTLPEPRAEGGIGFQFATPEFLPWAFGRDEEFAAETGFSLEAVDRFAEVSVPPGRATVMVGPAAWGGLTEPYVDGLHTIRTGDDFVPDLETRSPMDSLGRPLRVAEVDGRLVSSLSTAVLLGWADGTGLRYSEDDRLAPLAAELDKHEVISAFLFVGDFYAVPEFFPEDEEFPGLADGIYISQPFVAVGIGNAVRDGRAIEVVTYRFLTDAAAETALPSVENAWTSGQSIAIARPIAELAEFESIEQNGPVVTVVAVVPDDRVAPGFTMVVLRDVTMAHE